MIPVPAPHLTGWGIVLTCCSLLVLVFPWAASLLVVADIVLVGAALLDWLLTPKPRVLEVRRLAPERLSVLCKQSIALVLRSQAPVALSVRARDTIPEGFRVTTDEVSAKVPAEGETRCTYEVSPTQRGQFAWGTIDLRYRSVLGFWDMRKRVETPATVHVYPNLTELQRYHLLARANRLEAMGIRRIRQRGGAWELESLREYVSGDDIRQIDWKATARRRKLIVRNRETERNQSILLLLDCGRLMNAEVDGVAKLDHAVNTVLVLAHVALGLGDRVGLCTFSHKVHSWVPPRAHVAQNRILSDTLYNLRGDFTETDHGRCLRMLRSAYPKRSLLIVLTDFVDAQTSADMVAHLRQASRRHLVLFTALRDPFLERAAHGHPATPHEGFRKAAASDLLHERRAVLEQLRQAGAHILDIEPTGITPPLINRYLEIMLRGLL